MSSRWQRDSAGCHRPGREGPAATVPQYSSVVEADCMVPSIVGGTNMEIQTALDHTYPKFKSADVPEAKAVKRNVGEVAEGPAGTTTFMR